METLKNLDLIIKDLTEIRGLMADAIAEDKSTLRLNRDGFEEVTSKLLIGDSKDIIKVSQYSEQLFIKL